MKFIYLYVFLAVLSFSAISAELADLERLYVYADSIYSNAVIGVKQGEYDYNSNFYFVLGDNLSEAKTVIDQSQTNSTTIDGTTRKLKKALYDFQQTLNVFPEYLHACPGDSVRIEAKGFDSYLWSTGDTTSYTYLKKPIEYSVTVTKDTSTYVDKNEFVPFPAPPNVEIDGLWVCPPTYGDETSYEIKVNSADYVYGDEQFELVRISNENVQTRTDSDYSSDLMIFTEGLQSGDTLTIKVLNGFGCFYDTSVVFQIQPYIDVLASKDTVICDYEEIEVDSDLYSEIVWNTATQNYLGEHIITVTDSNNCTYVDTLIIDSVLPSQHDLFFTQLAPTYIKGAEHIILEGIPAGGNFSGSGVSGNILTPLESGEITYTIEEENGCKSTYSQIVEVVDSITVSSLNTIQPIISCNHLFTAMLSPGNGEVYAWGKNEYGGITNLLGTGSTEEYYLMPAKVIFQSDVKVTKVSAGIESFILALDCNENVWSWGINNYGQLGNNTLDYSTSPIRVLTGDQESESGFLENVKDIGTSNGTSYALLETGEVVVWGANELASCGQGEASSEYYTTPKYVKVGVGKKLKGIKQISSSGSYCIALDSTGQLYGWGGHAFGDHPLYTETSNGKDTLFFATELTHLVKAKSVTCNGSNIMFEGNDGYMYCGGDNMVRGTNSDIDPMSRVFTRVAANKESLTKEYLENITAYQIGYLKGYAVSKEYNNALLTWGGNLGLGESSNVPKFAKTINGNYLEGVVTVSANLETVFAVVSNKQSGEYELWGASYNRSGQLGNGTKDGSILFKKLQFPSDFSMQESSLCKSVELDFPDTIYLDKSDTLYLKAGVANQNGEINREDYSYQWYKDSEVFAGSTNLITVTSAGLYTIHATKNTSGFFCQECFSSDSVFVVYRDKPQMETLNLFQANPEVLQFAVRNADTSAKYQFFSYVNDIQPTAAVKTKSDTATLFVHASEAYKMSDSLYAMWVQESILTNHLLLDEPVFGGTEINLSHSFVILKPISACSIDSVSIKYRSSSDETITPALYKAEYGSSGEIVATDMVWVGNQLEILESQTQNEISLPIHAKFTHEQVGGVYWLGFLGAKNEYNIKINVVQAEYGMNTSGVLSVPGWSDWDKFWHSSYYDEKMGLYDWRITTDSGSQKRKMVTCQILGGSYMIASLTIYNHNETEIEYAFTDGEFSFDIEPKESYTDVVQTDSTYVVTWNENYHGIARVVGVETTKDKVVFTDTLTFKVIDFKEPFLGYDTVVCRNNGELKLSPGDFETYFWSTGETDSEIIITDQGIYSVTVSDGIQELVDSIRIEPFRFFTQIFPESSQSICAGDSVMLTIVGAESYVWNTGQTGNSVYVKPLQSMQVSAIATAENGCQMQSPKVYINVHSTDKEELNYLLDIEMAVFSGSEPGQEAGQYPIADYNHYQDVLLKAQAVAENNCAFQHEVNSSVKAIREAKPDFQSSMIDRMTSSDTLILTVASNVDSSQYSSEYIWEYTDGINGWVQISNLVNQTEMLPLPENKGNYSFRGYPKDFCSDQYVYRKVAIRDPFPSLKAEAYNVTKTSATLSLTWSQIGESFQGEVKVGVGIIGRPYIYPNQQKIYSFGLAEYGDTAIVINDLKPGVRYFVQPMFEVPYGPVYGDEVTFKTEYDITDTTDTIVDVNGNVYKTVKIGNQWWMAENMRTTRYADGRELVLGTPYSVNGYDYAIYDTAQEISYIDPYGYLYSWKGVLDNAEPCKSDTCEPQGICPNGWHIPRADEWAQLANNISVNKVQVNLESSDYNDTHYEWSTIGAKLKSDAGWKYSVDQDEFGFNSLPWGDVESGGGDSVGFSSKYIVASKNENYDGFFIAYLSTHQNEFNLFNYEYYNQSNIGISARCIKNADSNPVIEPPINTEAGLPVFDTLEFPYGEGSGEHRFVAKIASDGGTPILERGIQVSRYPYFDTSNNHKAEGTGVGIYELVLSLDEQHKFYARAYAINAKGISYSDDVVWLQGTGGGGGTILGSVEDFDGNVYPTVRIGEQWWMAQNLRSTHYSDGETIEGAEKRLGVAYVDTVGQGLTVEESGLLYSYTAAMRGMNFSDKVPSGIQGACPTGWHIPSYGEWEQMKNWLKANGYNADGTTDSDNVAKALAAHYGWHEGENDLPLSDTVNVPGTMVEMNNASGFTAIYNTSRWWYVGPYYDREWDDAYVMYMWRGSLTVEPDNSGTTWSEHIRCVRD